MEKIKRLDETTYELEINQTITVSFKLEEDFLRQVDEAVKVLGYSNRSDLIRDAIISYISYLQRNNRR
jgi:metal-responsive CopG/Arc/MetJ family transcriptional regulator